MKSSRHTVAELGSLAPEFSLRATADQTVRLADLRGNPVVLVFYPADWSPVCSDQLSLYNELMPELRSHGAQVLGISVDGVWCHAAFAKDRNLHFPLLADFEPKGRVAQLYGAYEATEGICKRALFVIDRDGVLRWKFVSPLGINPGANGILDSLYRLEGMKESAQ